MYKLSIEARKQEKKRQTKRNIQTYEKTKRRKDEKHTNRRIAIETSRQT